MPNVDVPTSNKIELIVSVVIQKLIQKLTLFLSSRVLDIKYLYLILKEIAIYDIDLEYKILR